MTTAPGTELSRAVLNRWRTRLAKQLGVERDLPWRRTRDPWEVLVAEVMLQQTQVSRVIPAWTGFLDLFPTPRACANAPQSEIVRAWEGLGYHRRAVALHGAAREVVARFGGELPDNLSDLLSLPGGGGACLVCFIALLLHSFHWLKYFARAGVRAGAGFG